MAGRRGNGENSVYSSGGRWHVQGYLPGRRRRVSRVRRRDALAAWDDLVAATPAPGRSTIAASGTPVGTVAEALEQ